MLRKKPLALVFMALVTMFGLAAPATATPTTGPIIAATPSHYEHGQNTCQTAPYQSPQGETSSFARWPFRLRDAFSTLVITQGWVVSEDEEPFVGAGAHGALDFEFVNRRDKGFGVPILAPADGCYYYSYQAFRGDYIDPAGRIHKIGLGAGLFIEGIHPNGWVSQLVHLDRVNKHKVPYIAPVPDGTEGDWHPAGVVEKSSAELKPLGKWVRRGEIIGWNGDTGITLDYVDAFDVATGTVTPRDRQAFPNWENGNAQLHFTMYQGRAAGGARQGTTDPLKVNGQITSTSDPYNKRPGRFYSGQNPLLRMCGSWPVYAGL